jgi:hypothetical protein
MPNDAGRTRQNVPFHRVNHVPLDAVASLEGRAVMTLIRAHRIMRGLSVSDIPSAAHGRADEDSFDSFSVMSGGRDHADLASVVHSIVDMPMTRHRPAGLGTKTE